MPLYGEKKREYDRNWMRKRRYEYFTGKNCAWCGSIIDLELHHLDPRLKKIIKSGPGEKNEEIKSWRNALCFARFATGIITLICAQNLYMELYALIKNTNADVQNARRQMP